MASPRQLTEFSSFTAEEIPEDNARKRFRFYYHAPEGKYSQMMVVTFPLGNPAPSPIEREMKYSPSEGKWYVDIERPTSARESFYIIPNITPKDELAVKQKQAPIETGFIANGKAFASAVNDAPKGKLERFVYTKNGELKPAVDESKLANGDRVVNVYFPPGYDPQKKPPYHLQITLDGKQSLETMHMNTRLDSLIATKAIEPVVCVFISPYTGSPNKDEPGFGDVAPPGYSLSQRYREYSCNPDFATQLAKLPQLLRQNRFNITDNPEYTTLWGYSLSGLQASYTALLHPTVFGNVVAQSPAMWWNGIGIPREKYTDQWQDSTAPLPPQQKDLYEGYLNQAVRLNRDEMTKKQFPNSKLNFYFESGSDEAKYEPELGTANLVGATATLADTLKQKGHNVTNIVYQGGHDPRNWEQGMADAAITISSSPNISAKLSDSRSSTTAKVAGTMKLDLSQPPTTAPNQMTFEQFDQSSNSYCRTLTAAGKFEEAAHAGIEYLHENAERLTSYQRCLLRWHIGQSFASCGRNDLAIQYFNLANEDKNNMAKIFGPAGNAYYKATIGFLNHDREMVKQQLQECMMIPINNYPRPISNVVLTPGRIHDMHQNPKMSYRDIFKMHPSLPPAPGQDHWYVINAKDMQEEGKLVGEHLAKFNPVSQLQTASHTGSQNEQPVADNKPHRPTSDR